MSLSQIVQALVRERLRCAAEQICAQLERSVAEYERELLRLKTEPRGPEPRVAEPEAPGTRTELEHELIRLRRINSEQQRRLEALEPGDQSYESNGTGDQSYGSQGTGDQSYGSQGTGIRVAGVQLVSVREEQEPPHIKVEPEEQLQELHFAPVKTEDDEDKSSVLHQRPTEENREETNGWDCGAEAGCSSDPLTQFHSDSEEHATDREEHVTDREDDFPQDQASTANTELVVKPHRCPECGKRFLRKDHLQGHMIIHTGERPHKCSFCEKTFIRQNHLKTHLRNHTGERPYSCPFCNRGFTTKALLTPHMRIHTGDRPFKCSECDKGFIQRSHLKAHVKTHSRDKTFSCLICRQVFYERGELMIHSRAAHPE